MPSNFPNEWSFAINSGGGQTPNVTVGVAGPTVRHVLTNVDLHLWSVSAGAGYNGGIALFDGASSMGFLIIAFMDGNPGTWDGSWSGEFIGTPGIALAVLTNVATPANIGALLTVRGYDL